MWQTQRDELIAFIRAQYDADEATARHSGPARVAWLTFRRDDGQMLYTTVAAADDHSPWIANGKELPGAASARVVYDPAQALLDIEAKRHILDEIVEQIDDMDRRIECEWGSGNHVTGESDMLLTLLAFPYSGRQGYKDDWKPTFPLTRL